MSYQRTPAAASAGGSTPADGSVTDAKVANGAAINLDKTADGTTNKTYTATEKTKLAGVATAATANDTDANLKARANHTGTQTASTISDFSTAADARITAATGASVEAHDADLTTIAGLSPSNDDVIQRKAGAWANRTMAQVKTDLALAKADVGLGSVDNTSDAGKPVSTAQQTALDGKQSLDSDLTTIAGLTATTDSFLQAKSSAWAARTVAQVQTDLGVSPLDSSGHYPETAMPLRARSQALTRRTGALAETFSRRGVVLSGNNATSQRIWFVAVVLLKDMVISTVTFCSSAAMVTGVNQWFCLYDGAGAKLRISNDDTSTAWAANTEKTLTLATTYTVTADALFYVGVMVNATTVPSLLSMNTNSTATALAPRICGFDNASAYTNPASAPANITWTSSSVEHYAWVA